MKRFFATAAIATLFLAPVLGGKASAQKGKSASTRVTTTIQGLGPDAAPTYRIQSDQLGSYRYGVDSVISEIQATYGDWVLDTASSTVRSVYVDFRDPVPGTNPNQIPPPFLYEQVFARLISKCSLFGGDLKTMRAGDALICPLSVRFAYAGATYLLRMNDNFPGTDYVRWSCLAEDSTGKCSQWKMEPGAEYGGEKKCVAQLIRMLTVRNKTTTEEIGKYYMSFVVDVTNP
ncbi:MAG TPA: hypothetical protein VNN73_15530 [Blastocatellia bacterium]|nr:hypothetical protein [Blastocatellia bacterium]